MIRQLLGGLTTKRFLAEYWQKRPLLIRNALPGFSGLIAPQEIPTLAARDDIETRLVWRNKQGWQLRSGPFETDELPKRGAWTVLVQGLNMLLPQADELLRQFSFIGYGRLDDLMVSYATNGGGVGPHFDSYDVFLLQGNGARRWQISSQTDLGTIEGAPLRILERFVPEQEWVLQPGDMLYLPPRYAHNGVAIGECTTYSIGFRAPSTQELAQGFLGYLQDKLDLRGVYTDPDISPTTHPAQLQTAMLEQIEHMLREIRWSNRDIEDFVGCYLSEPKPHVFFNPPKRRVTGAQFRRKASSRGLRLDLRTQMLYRGKWIFINGERVAPHREDLTALRILADRRALSSVNLTEAGWLELEQWYAAGWLTLL